MFPSKCEAPQETLEQLQPVHMLGVTQTHLVTENFKNQHVQVAFFSRNPRKETENKAGPSLEKHRRFRNHSEDCRCCAGTLVIGRIANYIGTHPRDVGCFEAFLSVKYGKMVQFSFPDY